MLFGPGVTHATKAKTEKPMSCSRVMRRPERHLLSCRKAAPHGPPPRSRTGSGAWSCGCVSVTAGRCRCAPSPRTHARRGIGIRIPGHARGETAQWARQGIRAKRHIRCYCEHVRQSLSNPRGLLMSPDRVAERAPPAYRPEIAVRRGLSALPTRAALRRQRRRARAGQCARAAP